MMDTTRIMAQLDDAGFAVIDRLIDHPLVTHLRAALESANQGEALRRRRGSMIAIRNLFDVAPSTRDIVDDAAIRTLVEAVLGPEAFVVRAILFDKTPQANWSVGWHQDTTIAIRERIDTPGFGPWSIKAGVPHVRPPSEILARMLTLRLHLDDTPATNGALRVARGTHQRGIVGEHDLRKMCEAADIAVCEIACGGALLMRPLLAHASSPGSRPGRRRVVHLEYAGGPLPGELQWHRA